jgi:hypothetical protein
MRGIRAYLVFCFVFEAIQVSVDATGLASAAFPQPAKM